MLVKGDKKQTIYSISIETPLGNMVACCTPQGICLLEFGDFSKLVQSLHRIEQRLHGSIKREPHIHLNTLYQQLNEYFYEGRRQFNVPLKMLGTEFQQQAWNALLAIKYGETWSYSKQAEYIGRLKAVRAVAAANANNAISIVVPCHRVIGANGDLCGYGGGLFRKRKLLELEQTGSQ